MKTTGKIIIIVVLLLLLCICTIMRNCDDAMLHCILCIFAYK